MNLINTEAMPREENPEVRAAFRVTKGSDTLVKVGERLKFIKDGHGLIL